jgi:hypothetical protein
LDGGGAPEEDARLRDPYLSLLQQQQGLVRERLSFRDAAPVTAAAAAAAAAELRAAAAAAEGSWRASALTLPPDVQPGLFTPAVLEAYPAAARAVDASLAQQAARGAMEVGGAAGALSVGMALLTSAGPCLMPTEFETNPGEGMVCITTRSSQAA